MAACLVAVTAAVTAACTSGSGAVGAPSDATSGATSGAMSGSPTITVTGTDRACTPSAARSVRGSLVLRFDNAGTAHGGVRVIGPDGTVEAELTYVQPGTSSELRLDVPDGSYALECMPGMVGRVIRAELAVGSAVGLDPRLANAVTAYRAWVLAQAKDSLSAVGSLRAALAAGDLREARRLYPVSRVGWERIEPVAEAFGDLDPRIDARLADLEAGQPWTGWHVIERGLYEGGTTAGLVSVATQLERDLGELVTRLPAAPLSVSSMAAGALTLLDEISRTKVTGEEEVFSHTDLVDFQANVAGSRRVVELFRPVLAERDPGLLAEIDRRFAAVQSLLDARRTGPGDTAFVPYTQVGEPERRALADAVDAVAEPVSRMGGALTRPTSP